MTEAAIYREYVTKNCRLGDLHQRPPLDLIVHDLSGECRGLCERNFRGARGIEGFRQITHQTLPGFSATRGRRHDGIDALQANIAQNKRHHRRWQREAPGQTTGGDAAAIVHLRQHLRQHLVPDGINRASPQLFFQRTGFGKLFATENALCAEAFQIFMGTFAARDCDDRIAELM